MGLYYTVVQGDCLSKIARRHGLASWRTIYDHENNAEFRELRPDPNTIFPGDVVFVPDRRRRDESGSTEQRHRFRVQRDEIYVRLWVQDEDDRPLTGARFSLEVEAKTLEGAIGDDGMIELKIDPGDEAGMLRVWPPPETPESVIIWQLRLGHLDPLGTTSGIQARLNNLGFDSGPVDGINGPLTKGAVRRFQEHYELLVDGIVGPQTRPKLQEVHRV